MISMLTLLFRDEFSKNNMEYLLKLAGDTVFLSALTGLALDVKHHKTRFVHLFMKSTTLNTLRYCRYVGLELLMLGKY